MRRYAETDPVVVRNEVRHFKHHLTSYVVVVGMLAGINILSGGFWQGNWWFLWIALFWGVALALHALRLFGDGVGGDWEDRMVAQVMARRSGQPAPPSRGSYPPPSSYRPPEPPQAPQASGSPAEAPPAPPPAAPPPPAAHAAGEGREPASVMPDPGTTYIPPQPPQP